MGLFEKILGKKTTENKESLSMIPFLKCLSSFFSGDDPSQVMKNCDNAIQEGLNLVDEAIIHGLLMNANAKQGDLENAQNELFRARENIGKVIGLSDQELQRFVQGEKWDEYERNIYELRYKEVPSKILTLVDINRTPIHLESMREDLSDEEKEEGLLRFWRHFPSLINSYWLLGESWSIYDTEEAIKWLKKAIAAVDENPWSHGYEQDSPPDILDLACRYQLGILYRKKGDIKLAFEEFSKVASASSHPNWDITDALGEEEKEFVSYLITRAKEELE